MKHAIRVEDLTKRFRKTTAVDGLSFQVPFGSVFALLGNNGAGKTTTIRCLLGLEEPNEGLIDVLGRDPRADSVRIRKLVGYVPEERHLYEWMRALEIGKFVGAFYPRWSAERFERILAHFEIPTDRRIAQLSRGMKAQLDLALAMGHEPELLILDEPTGGLDSVVRRDFLASMVEMAGQGRTVLVSSHEVAEVERVADRGLILYNSQLLWSGEFEQLKATTAEILLPSGVSADDAHLAPDDLIFQEPQADRLRLVLRCSPGEAREKLAAHAGADVRSLPLEDIFIAHLRGAGYRANDRTLHETAAVENGE